MPWRRWPGRAPTSGWPRSRRPRSTCAPGRTPSPSAARSADEQPGAEQVEDLLQRIAGGLIRLVDEVLGEHRVRHRRVPVGVALGRIDLDGDEAVAERLAEVLEAGRGHQLVPRE